MTFRWNEPWRSGSPRRLPDRIGYYLRILVLASTVASLAEDSTPSDDEPTEPVLNGIAGKERRCCFA